MPLTVRTLPLGPLQTNCHLIHSLERNEVIVVDPGEEPARLNRELEALGATVVAIWNTHAHFDHIGANAAVKAKWQCPIWIHAAGAPALEDNQLNGAALFGFFIEPSKADHLWKDGDVIEALGHRWLVRHVPGHSRACCAIVSETEPIAMVGDLVFKDGVGRYDLPGGNFDTLCASLRRFFREFSARPLNLYNGHGPSTTLQREAEKNPFVAPLLEED